MRWTTGIESGNVPWKNNYVLKESPYLTSRVPCGRELYVDLFSFASYLYVSPPYVKTPVSSIHHSVVCAYVRLVTQSINRIILS